ncbi:MAG: hypothetical protein V4466_16560 [Pseudomonadota bacterium]
MTADDEAWNGWADSWRQDGADPALDIAEIEARVRHEQIWQTFRTRLDLAASLLALAICGWAIAKGTPAGIVLGLAGLAFTLFSLVVTLGRERAPSALASRTVAAALGWEIATAKASVRSALGGMAVAAASLLFLVVCSTVFRHEGALKLGTTELYALGAALLFSLGSAGTSAWLYRRRQARVARLERLLADLTEDGGD